MKTKFKVITLLCLVPLFLASCGNESSGSAGKNSGSYVSSSSTSGGSGSADTYTITWENYDSSILEVDRNVPKGATPHYDGETPAKPSTDSYYYTFAGWSPDISPVTSNRTYVAKYDQKQYGPGIRDITFDCSEVLLGIGKTKTISYSVTPSSYKSEVSVMSYNEDIVSVSGNTLTGKETGETKIIAFGNNGFYKELDVKVYVPVEQIRYYTSYSASVNVQGYWKGYVETQPANADMSVVNKSFQTSDNSIVDIDKDTGFIICRKKGEATITTIFDLEDRQIKSETRFVVLGNNEYIEATSITYSGFLSLNIGSTSYLSFANNPSGSFVGARTYESSDPRIATVNAKGDVTGVTIGQCSITLKSELGITASYYVVVSGTYANNLKSSSSTYTISPGETVTMGYSFTGNADKTMKFSSTNDEIASVSEKGVIKGVSSGTCKIIATLLNNEKVESTVIVTELVAPTNVSLNPTTLKMDPTTTSTVTATLTPSNANTQNKITWETSDSNIATVTNGIVAAKKPGNCLITASLPNGLFANCLVTVNDYTYPTNITLSKSSLSINPKATSTLTATVTPSNWNIYKIIKWSSSNERVATVANGVVTGIAPGNCEIIASLENGLEATCLLTVNDYIYPTGITLTLSKNVIDPGQTVASAVTFTPSNANNGLDLTYYSSDSYVGEVDGTTGVVTGKHPGTCTIYCRNNYGVIGSAALTVNNYISAQTVAFTQTTYTIKPESNTVLSVNYTPTNCNTGKAISFFSNNTSIATIDKNGILHGVRPGTTTIGVELQNGYYSTASVVVEDFIYATSVTLGSESITMQPSKFSTLSYTISPSNAERGKTVTWSSSDENIASVSEKGVVSSKKAGICYIYCTLENGAFDECKVTVTDVTPIIRDDNTLQNYSNSKCIYMTRGEKLDVFANTGVNYYSENRSVAYYSNGKIFANDIGETRITATNSEGVSSTLNIVVYDCGCIISDTTINNYKNVNSSEIKASYKINFTKQKFIKGKDLVIDFDIDKQSGLLETCYVAFDVYNESNSLVCTKVFVTPIPLLFNNKYSYTFTIDLSDFDAAVYDMQYRVNARSTFIQ